MNFFKTSFNKAYSIYQDIFYKELLEDLQYLNIDSKLLKTCIHINLYILVLTLYLSVTASNSKFISISLISFIINIFIHQNKIKQHLNSINKFTYFLLIKLNLLCIKNQIPLLKALKIIRTNTNKSETLFLDNLIHHLDTNFNSKVSKTLFHKLKYQNDLHNIINALRTSNFNQYSKDLIQNTKSKINNDIETEQNDLVENLQLYLLVPSVCLLIIAVYPLFSSILFTLKRGLI
ncbi:MAG: hypothetical protein MK033_09100 [Candidatus Caenarcaniphilales bacterium]|nr:hypothetical protein [Candidatus Caenarcaniphilales bacterium]